MSNPSTETETTLEAQQKALELLTAIYGQEPCPCPICGEHLDMLADALLAARAEGERQAWTELATVMDAQANPPALHGAAKAQCEAIGRYARSRAEKAGRP